MSKTLRELENKYKDRTYNNHHVTFNDGCAGNTTDLNDYHSMATELRISNLEKRLESAEKMIKFYEEMMRLKDEEKRNDYKIDQNKIVELNNKVDILEDGIKIVYKKLSDFNNYINDKFEAIDKKFQKNNDTKNNISDFYASKVAEMETLLNKNNLVLENLMDDKIGLMQNNFDSKIDEVLSLVNEVNRIVEKNDYTSIESKDAIRMIQNDHLAFIKIVSLLKEKSDNLDYVMEQITDLKQRYSKVITLYSEHSQEEDKFLNKMFNVNTDENN
jgi:hypothetical protein